MPTATTPELEAELLKIRPHVTSRLAHQKAPAALLRALESTFEEQSTVPNSVAYFAALVTTLEQTIQKESLVGPLDFEEGAILPAILYLLALVLPTVPSPVIRSNLAIILPILAQILPPLESHAPPLRSTISIFAATIPPLEVAQLSTPQLRQCFASLLGWALDPRPKVRKRAQEALLEILGSPPAPLVKHPFLEQTADYVMGVLNAVQNGSIAGKGADGSAEIGIWCCALVKSISGVWPESHLSALITTLLALPRFSSPYLTSQSFTLLTSLLNTPTLTPTPSHLPTILLALTTAPPPPSAVTTAQSWLEAIENTMVAYARSDAADCETHLSATWDLVWGWLKVDSVPLRASAERALCAMARYCLRSDAIVRAVTLAQQKDTKKYSKSILGHIINQLSASLEALPFARAVASLLKVLTSLISRLRFRPTSVVASPDSRPPTAAEILLPDLIKHVGRIRIAKRFEHRERADEVLGMAIEVMGPKIFLELLPLNILPSEMSDDEGRAFLLPLLASHITNTNLSHFVTFFLPLSEKLFELHSSAEEKGKGIEAKLWEACIDQVWACLKGYCEAPVDLSRAFTTPFAQLLTRLLYSHPSLRPPILRAFQAMLRSTTSLASSSTPSEEMVQSFGIDRETAQQHVAFIQSITGNMLSVLFNVFSTVASDSRVMIGEVIAAWLSVAEPKDIEATYVKLVNMLTQAPSRPPTPDAPPVSHTMLDLLILIIPHLSNASATNLYKLALSSESNLLESTDQVVQKKTYRILGRLVESSKVLGLGASGNSEVEVVLKRLEESTDGVSAGSKRDRLHLITALVSLLPVSSLHHVSLLLPEAILSTKEVGEKARNEAFDLIVAMGNKMQAGGVVRRAELDGMDEDEGGEVEANLGEYLTMAAAGLAGASPHMISATITAIARIVFEFKDSIPENMQSDITSTMIVFLKSNNREIVKSALGFVKVATVSLPPPVARLHMNDLVPALLGWSHDHKNHFKSKVKHIFERMIRRFGWDDIWNAAGNDENAKVLTNIRKRTERSKKIKAAGAELGESSDDDKAVPKASTGSAFQDVLYGSESEGSEVESREPRTSTRTNKEEARLHADNDSPTDLLSGGASHITTAGNIKRRKPGQEAAHFKMDDETGRMVIDDDDDREEAKLSQGKKQTRPRLVGEEEEEDLAGKAYMEQLTSRDGFTRTATGAVKFHKDTKKRRAIEMEEDTDMDGQTKPTVNIRTTKTSKKKHPVRLGQEFKAKKAGGDVKRAGQQDPYAYLPLSQVGVGKKRGSKPTVNITGKR